MRKDGQPDRQISPDAEFFKMAGVGCGVVFLVFLCGWAAIALFWLGG